jgi:hypothetical protein
MNSEGSYVLPHPPGWDLLEFTFLAEFNTGAMAKLKSF